MNRTELVKSMSQAATELLHEKGYISFVDVLIRMGKLTREDHEAWRTRKVHYLERVIKINLAQVNHLLRTLQKNSSNGGLKASKTAYTSWGKGRKTALRFSKTGDPNLEAAYATHYLRQQTAKAQPAAVSGLKDHAQENPPKASASHATNENQQPLA